MSDYRTLTQYFVAATLAVVSWGCSQTSAPSLLQDVPQEVVVVPADAEPKPTSLFFVDFTGIILHVADPTKKPTLRRAVVIEASLFKPHQPALYVIAPKDANALSNLKARLNATTGQIVKCNQNQCRVKVGGFAMRIRGDSSGKPITPLAVDESFKCLLPHLRDDPAIDAGAIRSEIVKASSDDTQAILPSGSALGFFEIENGRLEATPFEDPAYFQTALKECMRPPYVTLNDKCREHSPDEAECKKRVCRQFADVVTWSGETDGPAVLEIASYQTAWEWERIAIGNQGPLMISVENLASSNHNTAEHFKLNEKLLVNKTLPIIHPCDTPCKVIKPPGSINAINVG